MKNETKNIKSSIFQLDSMFFHVIYIYKTEGLQICSLKNYNKCLESDKKNCLFCYISRWQKTKWKKKNQFLFN